MNSQEVAYLTLRIFSLFIIVTNLQNPMLHLYPYFFGSFESATFSLDGITLIIGMTPLFMGIYLWLSSKKLVSLFMLSSSKKDLELSGQSLDTFKLAIVILGLYLMAVSLPNIFYTLNFFLETYDSSVYQIDQSTYNHFYAKLAQHSISFIIGFSMFVGSNFYIKAFHYGRTMWLNKE